MNRRTAGFTLIEMMIAMAIVMVVLYAAINFFIVSVRQYKVQTKITETNVEGILGLELFRQDLENLGFGLPWNNLGTYSERAGNGSILNDAGGIAPKAVLSINAGGGFTVNNSDYLAIKSARVGMSDAAGKWTTLTKAGLMRTWSPNTENLIGSDRVIVLSVGSTDANRRSLVNNTSPYPTFGALGPSAAAFLPGEPYTANIVYGIDNVLPVRPFNRADYYIDNSVAPPQRCAPHTGTLVKEVVAHDVNGTTAARLPLLDCAADMQVVYGLDVNGDGVVDNTYSDAINGMTAALIRAQVVEVRVHILAQEGQRDDSYTYPYDNVTVGSEGAGRTFDYTSSGFVSTGASNNNFKHYRWKVYNIVVKPKNLAQ
jgi:prepilin-type N-terminal cleavage/methylation domain-containing protein